MLTSPTGLRRAGDEVLRCVEHGQQSDDSGLPGGRAGQQHPHHQEDRPQPDRAGQPEEGQVGRRGQDQAVSFGGKLFCVTFLVF